MTVTTSGMDKQKSWFLLDYEPTSVCVCVCVRERERSTEELRLSLTNIFSFISVVMVQ